MDADRVSGFSHTTEKSLGVVVSDTNTVLCSTIREPHPRTHRCQTRHTFSSRVDIHYNHLHTYTQHTSNTKTVTYIHTIPRSYLTTVIAAETYYHVLAVLGNDGGMRLYINGVLDAEGPGYRRKPFEMHPTRQQHFLGRWMRPDQSTALHGVRLLRVQIFDGEVNLEKDTPPAEASRACVRCVC